MECKKDLYKSTYKGLAFKKGNQYEVVDDDKDFVWIIDERGHEFSFSKTKRSPFYFIDDYFKEDWQSGLLHLS